MAHLPKGQGLIPFPPFKAWLASNIPAVYDNTMSYYEELVALIKYLQDTVVPAVNSNASAITTLSEAIENLQAYVDNYFVNLDVQEEINNKLDQMAADGTLQEIITTYIQANVAWTFDTVADMKSATNLISGSYAQTLGYYALNDGGGATYKIRKVTNDDTVDEMFIVEIGDTANELVAELILEDKINIRQLGAVPMSEDGTKHDIKSYIDRYLSKIDEVGHLLKLYIPSGVWHTTGNFLGGSKNGWSIEGDETFSRFYIYADGTIITTYSDNQSYIFKLGDAEHTCHDWTLKNITFSSADFTYENGAYNYSAPKTVTKALALHKALFGLTDNVFFNTIKGRAFTIRSSWGNYFKLLNFYQISNENSAVSSFETYDSTMGEVAGIIGNNFEKIMFERCHGNMMHFEENCKVYNNHFGTIRVEPGDYTLDGRTYSNFTDEILSTWDDNTCTHYAILNMSYKCSVGENIFDNLELNNVAHDYYEYNGNKYTYDTIIKYGSQCYVSNIFTNIANNGMLKDTKVLYIPASVTQVQGGRSFNTFTNFTTPDAKSFIFDVSGLNDINLPDNVYLHGNRTMYNATFQVKDSFVLGGWIPAFKAMGKRQYSSAGKGFLYYDADSLNNANLVIIPRTDITDTQFLNTIVNSGKILHLRMKIPNGEVAKINIRNRTKSEMKSVTLDGTGNYKVYSINLTDTWNIGDYIGLTCGGTLATERVMSIDCYKSE